MEKLLSVREVAALLGRHHRTIRGWIKSGKLRGVRIPGRWGAEWRIPESAVQEIVDIPPQPVEFAPARRCAGTSKDGSPCQAPALRGSDFCQWHQHQAEGGQSDETS